MEKGGFTAVTIEGVAQRAGVGKPTIYRSWPNAQAVAMAAMLETSVQPGASAPTRSGLRALRLQLREIAKLFATPLGRNVTMMVAASEPDTELAKVFRNHFILARREEGRRFLEEAIEQNEVRKDVDLEVALDLIYAPIFYRQLAGHKALDAGFTEQVLRHALRGLAK